MNSKENVAWGAGLEETKDSPNVFKVPQTIAQACNIKIPVAKTDETMATTIASLKEIVVKLKYEWEVLSRFEHQAKAMHIVATTQYDIEKIIKTLESEKK